MKTMLAVLSLLFFKATFGQNGVEAVNGTLVEPTSVIVHKDARIDLLVKKKAAINKAAKLANTRSMRGYRLLVLNTNNRNDAVAAKSKIYNFFPELKSYLSYQSPYFKLKAGNFKTRTEAERYRKNMNLIFPKGVFIINETIEIKPEKEKEEEEI